MACIAPPQLLVPTLGGGLSLAADVPSFSGDLTWCCKFAMFATLPVAVSFGVPLDPAINTAIRSFVGTVQAYIDALPPECPKL